MRVALVLTLVSVTPPQAPVTTTTAVTQVTRAIIIASVELLFSTLPIVIVSIAPAFIWSQILTVSTGKA